MRPLSKRGSLILRYGVAEILLLAAGATLTEVSYSVDDRGMSLALNGAALVLYSLLVVVMIVMFIHVPARERKRRRPNPE
jgi:hypothetical protein